MFGWIHLYHGLKDYASWDMHNDMLGSFLRLLAVVVGSVLVALAAVPLEYLQRSLAKKCEQEIASTPAPFKLYIVK